MAFTYYDFESPDYSTDQRLDRLRRHIAEVSAEAASAAVSASGKSRDPNNLTNYLKDLRARLIELESGPLARRAGGISKVRFGTA